jgi:uncharacterized protein YqjF (DUF2071 family)
MNDQAPQAFTDLVTERELSSVPTPRGGWIMGQRWEDLLFLNWPIDAERLRRFVPDSVQIDEIEGSAWVSIVPFWMEDAHFRGLPPIPFLSSFPEVNVRTYVSAEGHNAVWFLSLDTESHVNVFLARHAFHLPYEYAEVEMRRGEEIEFQSARPDGLASIDITYRADGPESIPAEGSLQHFLTERYSLMCSSEDGDLYRGDIQHAPWRVQNVAWKADRIDLLSPLGLEVEGDPVAFFAQSTDVVLWPLVRM